MKVEQSNVTLEANFVTDPIEINHNNTCTLNTTCRPSQARWKDLEHWSFGLSSEWA